jgi:alpha-methylacyl-CoA racemase
LDPASLPPQHDQKKWPEMRTRFAEVFRSKTRDQWTVVFEGKDACVAPVLELDEVQHHPHNRDRDLLMTLDGVLQPAPAPRLSRTSARADKPCRPRGTETREIMAEAGYSGSDIDEMIRLKVVEEAS